MEEKMTIPSSVFLSNVPPSTAVALSWSMLVVVGIFLISGPIMTYIYFKKNKNRNAAPAASSA